MLQLHPHSAAAQAAFTRLACLYVSLQDKVPKWGRGFLTLRWPAFMARALAQSIWLCLCFAFPADQGTRLGLSCAQGIADVCSMWTSGTLSSKLVRAEWNGAGAAVLAAARRHRKQDFMFPLPIFYVSKVASGPPAPADAPGVPSTEPTPPAKAPKQQRRHIHAKDTSRRARTVKLSHSLFVQEYLRRGRGNAVYMQLREELHGAGPDPNPTLPEPGLAGQASPLWGSTEDWLTDDASMDSMGPFGSLLSQASAREAHSQRARRKVAHAREALLKHQPNLPVQQLQDYPPYPSLAVTMSFSETSLRDRMVHLDVKRPRDAAWEVADHELALPAHPQQPQPSRGDDLSALSVSQQVRQALHAEAGPPVLRPWSLPNGSLSVAAVSILESCGSGPGAKQPPTEPLANTPSYFAELATLSARPAANAAPTPHNRALLQETRARLSAKAAAIKQRHSSVQRMLKARATTLRRELRDEAATVKRMARDPSTVREEAQGIARERQTLNEEKAARAAAALKAGKEW